jgi:hypothetical protein
LTDEEREIELARMFSGLDYEKMCNGGIVIDERGKGVGDTISNKDVRQDYTLDIG